MPSAAKCEISLTSRGSPPSRAIQKVELDALYQEITLCHAEHLARYGVALPSLKNAAGSYTKNAVVLALLYKYRGQKVSKEELSIALSTFFRETITDSQQARHLGKQGGWYILSGQRSQQAPPSLGIRLGSGDYCLVSVTEPYPDRLQRPGHHRAGSGTLDFTTLKAEYGFRCATCGSKEGEHSFLDSASITKLQKAHMNPTLALGPRNMIPQCSECNRAYRDWFIFDGAGRVVDINLRSDKWKRIYKRIDTSGT